MKSSIFPFPKKGHLDITENYRGKTLILMAAKVFNTLLFNHTYIKLRKVFAKIRLAFGEIDPQHDKFWLSVESS